MTSSIAGQGTIGLEILDQLPDAEAIVVPIGGGGLIAGVALAVKSLRPDVKIYGVQAAGAASMYNAFRDKTYETLDAVDTFADGIAVQDARRADVRDHQAVCRRYRHGQRGRDRCSPSWR